MATVTVRNLSDDIVLALKERARRNSRSMEAEVRELLTRAIQGEERLPSRLEDELARRLPPPRRWSTPASEIMARLDANPSTEEQRRVLAEWGAEIDTDRDEPFFLDTLDDPWGGS